MNTPKLSATMEFRLRGGDGFGGEQAIQFLYNTCVGSA